MPVSAGDDMVERYEDVDDDVYDIPEDRLNEFLDTGNFERV